MTRPGAVAWIVVGVLLATGCGKKAQPAVAPAPPPPVVEAPPPPPPPPPPDPPPPAPTAALSEEEIFARKTVDELNAERPLDTVYFDYDRSDLREDARNTVARHADWMRRWSSTRIVIEGHCDERGTAEYNVALGDRRAQAVRTYLMSLGISPDRVQAISKGKETPVCTDSTESCWQQNRRGFSLITAK